MAEAVDILYIALGTLPVLGGKDGSHAVKAVVAKNEGKIPGKYPRRDGAGKVVSDDA